MFIVKVGVSQQYNKYTKTAIFLEKVVVSCTGASRRVSDLVQYKYLYDIFYLKAGVSHGKISESKIKTSLSHENFS